MRTAYVIEHGDAWLETVDGRTGRRIDLQHVADGSALLAVAWETSEGTVLKRGSEAMVRAWVDGPKGKVSADLYGGVLVAAFPVHAATIELLNRLAENPHRGSLIEADLAAIGAAHPDLALPKWVPS